MNGHRKIAALAALVVGLSVSGAAIAQDKVLAKIDGQPVTEKDVAAASASLTQQLAQLPEDARKRAVLDRLIDMKIIAATAAKAGLDQSESFKSRLDQLRMQLLVNEYVKAKVETAVTDEAIKGAL